VARTIRTTAFRPVPGAGPWREIYQTLSFPPHWTEPLLELYRTTRQNPDKAKTVPIWRLNQLLRAVAPDLTSVATEATTNTAEPWLFTCSPLPPTVLSALVNTWVMDLQPDPSADRLRREVMAALRPADLEWQPTVVDLTEHTVSAGGTVLPAARLFHLLPDVLAQRILALPPYEFKDRQLRFRATATPNGAELVSWPPRPHQGASGRREWQFSFLIRLSLHTVPFCDHVRIHVHTGVRRWATGGKVYLPPKRAVTCYLATDAPWLSDAPGSTYLAASALKWNPQLQRVHWQTGGPDGMLQRLTFDRDFPDPKLLTTEPDPWLHGNNGITAAVAHHTMMGTHGVGAGLMPADRAPLLEWLTPALQPMLQPLPDFIRSTMPARPVNPPDKTSNKDKQTPEYANRRRDECATVRARTARAIESSTLAVDVLYQSSAVRDAIVTAAIDSLDLPEPDTSTAELCTWRTPELDVHMHLRPLGELGSPLPVTTTTKESDAAITARRAAVRDRLIDQTDNPRLTIVELAGKEAFTPRTTDPKFALRLGLAGTGRISQFLTVPDERENTQRTTQRAQSAWNDGLRQLGIRDVPQHSLSPAIPDRLQYIALWMIKRRADGPTRHSLTTPVAILIRPDTHTILGRIPGMPDWVTYPKLLLALAAEGTRTGPAHDYQKSPDTAGFLKRVLYGARHRPTLLLTHAQNTRSNWPWLNNGNLTPNQIQFGDAPAHDIDLEGPQLRVIRVRTTDMNETPQWYAPTTPPGFATGLWCDPTNPAAFASTTEKASTAKNAAVTASKLAQRTNLKGNTTIDTGENAWNPQLLEIAALALQDGDQPEPWAALTHQLRYPANYRDPLSLPFPLHLAQLSAEYVLPHDDDGPYIVAADDSGLTP
jgi:hypothetical protein